MPGTGPERPVDHPDLEVADLGPERVQVQLVPVLAGLTAVAHHPVGVAGVEVAHRVHHLRLQPDAEPDAAGRGGVGQRGQSPGQLRRVRVPVAQRRGVVVPGMRGAEPPVVEQEQVRAQVRGAVDQADDAVLVEVEEGGLPVVDHQWPEAVRVTQDAVPGPAMEPSCGPGPTRAGPRPGHRGRHESHAGIQHVLRPHRVGTGPQPHLPGCVVVGGGTHVQVDAGVAAPCHRQRR